MSTSLPKSSRKHILLFLFSLLILVFIPRVFLYVGSSHLNSPQRITSTNHFYSKSKKNFSIPTQRKSWKKRRTYYNRPSKRFNPNDYKLEDWMKLGLSEKQSAVILKFTKYGIYSLDKLERIFVIPPELFALIKDSVYFPDRWEKRNDQYDRSVNKVTLPKSIIELNTSSQEQLESIKGVGPFFAKQIIRYRERLGGYISIDQLSEVWKMNDSISERISPYLDIDPTQLRKLNINYADVEELKNHPYITWNMANSIVKMRAQLGSFKYLEELKKSKLISDETFEKIKPYLTL